jgi:hypothetical protein
MSDWIKTAKVGDKIVAIPVEMEIPQGCELLEPIQMPEVGKEYTISEIIIGVLYGTPCIKVDEIAEQRIRVKINGDELVGGVVFEASGFRPVQRRTTDITVFQRMLSPVREDA